MKIIQSEDVIKYYLEHPGITKKEIYKEFPFVSHKQICSWISVFLRRKVRDSKDILIGMRQGVHRASELIK